MGQDDESEGDEPVGVGLHDPGRLLALTDGVFAISMTLLALDVRFPADTPITTAAFNHAAPNFYGRVGVFFVAFLLAGRFWIGSHHALKQLHRVDEGVLMRSITFLFGICTIPVATSVLFQFGKLPVAVTFASVVLAGTALLSARLWWYLSRPERGLADVDPDDRQETMIRLMLITAAYLLAVPVAYVLPEGKQGWAPIVWVLFMVIDRISHFLHLRIKGFRGRPAV